MLLDETIRELLRSKLAKLNDFRPISEDLLGKLKERFEIEMTYNSNGIEGNTLTLKETFWVIQQGITVKGKPLKDHLEARNHKEALEYLYESIQHKNQNTISEHTIKQFHHLVVQDTNKSIAGQYRDVDVFITGTEHKPPSALEVPQQMQQLIKWAQNNNKKLDIVEFAAIFHHKFVHIHPFRDGNGRTGRILMNIFLMNFGFPMTIILKSDRKKYYRVLADADYGNYKPLVNFVAQAVLRSLNIYLDVLTPAKEKETYLALSKVARKFSYSAAYLGKLAKEGKIDAHKDGRNWVTTKEAVQRYIDSLN